MKKLLLSMFALAMTLCAKAETVVNFDFDKDATALFGIEGRSSGSNTTYVADGEFNTDGVATVDGVTVTVQASAKDAQNRNRLWASSPVLRMYNGTLTVSAEGHNITNIVFSAGSNFNIESVSTGTLEEKTWIADKETSSVVFTILKKTQIKSMSVTLDGKVGEGPAPVEIAGTGEGTVDSPYDVERALSLITNDKVTNAKVYVAGTIVEVTEVNTQYGNATYTIGQDGEFELKIYRGYYVNGDKFTAEDQIKVGDKVIVYGVLTTNYGGQITTGSQIYSLNGEVVEPEVYTPVGNGTKENPYTVTDIQKLNIETSDSNSYWVKGYILGSAASATSLYSEDKAVDTNIALGETADATTFIPVALPAGDIRTELGVKTNPQLIGRQVMVYGTLEKYFSTAGVKNVTEYVLPGSSSIMDIDAAAAPARYYNIQGVEVANPINGHLYIRVANGQATKVRF